MIDISNCSLRAFIVAIRWAKLNGYPNKISDITPEQNKKLQAVCHEIDRREKLKGLARTEKCNLKSTT